MVTEDGFFVLFLGFPLPVNINPGRDTTCSGNKEQMTGSRSQ